MAPKAEPGRRRPDTDTAASIFTQRETSGSENCRDHQKKFGTANVEELQPTRLGDWSTIQQKFASIPIPGVDAWTRFRSQIFAGVLPASPNSGVAVSLERGDYFFFYDRAGRFRARRLIDKPPWYDVGATIDLQKHYDRWQPVLEDFLAHEGLDTDQVLFNTGDLEPGAIPFIYINSTNKLIVLIRYDELPPYLESQVSGAH